MISMLLLCGGKKSFDSMPQIAVVARFSSDYFSIDRAYIHSKNDYAVAPLHTLISVFLALKTSLAIAVLPVTPML